MVTSRERDRLQQNDPMLPEQTSIVLPHVPVRRFTVEEYQRLGEAGILRADERVELIDGVIVEMPPIGPEHAGQVDDLVYQLTLRLPDQVRVRAQNPLQLSDQSLPEPDVAVVRSRSDSYRRSHPSVADVLLIIEVSDTTVRFDAGEKAQHYARSGIPEYWMFDVPDRSIRVFRSPSLDGYRQVSTVRAGDRLNILALPDIDLDVAELLGLPGAFLDQEPEG